MISIEEEEKRAKIYVHTDQRPLASGRNGQNVRLASGLTGYELDILDLTELKAGEEGDAKLVVEEVAELPISEEAKEALVSNNLSLVGQLKGLSAEDYVSVGLTEEQAEEVVNIMQLVK